MNKEELRPIGTIIKIKVIPGLSDWSETDDRPRTIIYRITNHAKIARFEGDTEGTWKETVEMMDMQYEERQNSIISSTEPFSKTTWKEVGSILPKEGGSHDPNARTHISCNRDSGNNN